MRPKQHAEFNLLLSHLQRLGFVYLEFNCVSFLTAVLESIQPFSGPLFSILNSYMVP